MTMMLLRVMVLRRHRFGIAGYEQSFLGAASSTSNRPANVDTAYAKDARVPCSWWWWFLLL